MPRRNKMFGYTRERQFWCRCPREVDPITLRPLRPLCVSADVCPLANPTVTDPMAEEQRVLLQMASAQDELPAREARGHRTRQPCGASCAYRR